MSHDNPPPPALEADDLKAPIEAKRTWSKPTVKRMSYLHVVATGPHYIDYLEQTKYSITTSA